MSMAMTPNSPTFNRQAHHARISTPQAVNGEEPTANTYTLGAKQQWLWSEFGAKLTPTMLHSLALWLGVLTLACALVPVDRWIRQASEPQEGGGTQPLTAFTADCSQA